MGRGRLVFLAEVYGERKEMSGKINDELIPTCPDPKKDGLVWKNVSNEIKLLDPKANPFGWSQYRMEWKGETVGWLESGSPDITGKNWQMAQVRDPIDGINHVFFFKGMIQEDWDAIEYLERK